MNPLSPLRPSASAMTRLPLKASPRFQGTAQTSGTVLAGGGVLATLAGVIAFAYGQMNYRQFEKPTPVEQVMRKVETDLKKDILAGHAFDSISDGIKRGTMRFITGDRSSDERIASGQFKILRNDQLEIEDHVMDAATQLVGLTGNAEAGGTFKSVIHDSKGTRSAYFDALELIETIHVEAEPAGNFISRFFQDREKAKLEAALKELTANDRRALSALFTQSLGAGSADKPLDSAQGEALYNGIIDTLVTKYAPEDVEACKQAGKTLFASEHTYVQNRLTENQKRADLNRLALTIGGAGLLALIVGMALAQVVAGNPADEKANGWS